ncbi:MAG: hypothetical protein ACI8UO_004683 [Verrucomicrobiales bacterium]|jgi:hypothetical protein
MNKKAFLSTIDTLKLYRRAELLDEQGKAVITDLYVDPLPDQHILKTLLRPNTTFLIGRKGTGKSTIFQRAQESLNQEPQATWAYIDIKTLYESSTSEVLGSIPVELQETLSADSIQRINIFKSFILELIREIKRQIDARIKSSVWTKVKEVFTGAASELFEDLDEFVDDIAANNYIDVTGHIKSSQDDRVKRSETTKAGAEVGVNASSGLSAKLIAELVSELEESRNKNYSQIFIRT